MVARQYYLTTFGAWRKRSPLFSGSHFVALATPEGSPLSGAADEATVLALIAADEAAHISLEHDPDFEALPHPLVRVPVSARVAAALAPFGVTPTDDTFAVSTKLARIHPLLRHRIF